MPVRTYDEALTKALEFQHNYEAKEYYERICLRYGPPDAAARQWLEEDLCWLLCRNRRADEAVQLAEACWLRYGDLTSALRVVDAYYSHGWYTKARETLLDVESRADQWGAQLDGQKDEIARLRGVLAVRTFRCTYTIPAPNLTGRPSVVITPPLTMPPWQVLERCEIRGGTASEQRLSEEGDPYYVVAPRGGEDITVVADVVVTPTSLCEAAASYRDAPLPDALRPYLGPVPEGDQSIAAPRIDPSAPTACALAATLRGNTALETIENIETWMSSTRYYGGVEPEHQEGVPYSEVLLALRGGGHCETGTEAFITLARACGIPARALRGHSGLWHREGTFLQHTIPEFYIAGIGWMTWDGGPYLTTMSNFVGRYHIRGRDYSDRDVDLSFMDASEMAGGTCTYELLSGSLVTEAR